MFAYGYSATTSAAFLVDWLERLAQISGDARKTLVSMVRARQWELEDFAREVVKARRVPPQLLEVMSGFEIAVVQRAWNLDFEQNAYFAQEMWLPSFRGQALAAFGSKSSPQPNAALGSKPSPQPNVEHNVTWEDLAEPGFHFEADGEEYMRSTGRPAQMRPSSAPASGRKDGATAPYPWPRTSGQMDLPASLVVPGSSTRAGFTRAQASAVAAARTRPARPVRARPVRLRQPWRAGPW